MPLSTERRLWFPNLTGDNHVVTSSESLRYNCIAWSYDGSQTRAMWPAIPDDYFWPDGVREEESVNSFASLFQRIGYVVCPSFEHEAGFQKIVIYAEDDDPLHVAHELPSGRWSSKLGDWEDIEHESPMTLADGRYGRPVVAMRRSVMPKRE